ncbi:MAG: hypothetical protein DRP84_11805 [Spirochaetes bacterium]|nr:MAG: hypothetical protein DRP84_11805 [Spirochaetota bacterium]
MEKFSIFLIIPILRFLLNLNNFLYLRTVLHQHDKFLAGKVKNASEKEKRVSQKAARWIQANQTEIKRRVLNAGVEEQIKSFMEPIGLGYGQTKNISTLDNLLFMNKEIIASARQTISIAKGHYWTQTWLSLSPLFWIEMVIFLPREILKMAGLESPSKIFQIIVKILQLIYWIISIVYIILKVLK